MKKIIIIASILMGFLSFQVSRSLTTKESLIEKAFAATELNPANFNMNLVADRGNFVRFLYYMVNGPADGYTLSGPESGFVGLINDLTTQMSEGIDDVTECSELPTSGTKTLSLEEGSVVITYAEGSRTIPEFFTTSGGETFDKKITATLDGSSFLTAEFKCPADSTVYTGYMRMTLDAGEGPRNFETFFQYDSSTNAALLDFFMTYTPGSEKFGIRFQTSDGDAYKLWMIRVADDGDGTNGAYFGVHGKKSLNIAALKGIYTQGSADDSSEITDGDLSDCIDVSSTSPTTSTECDENSIAVTNPEGKETVGDEERDWTISSINDLSLTALE